MLRRICAECKADLGSIPSERDGVSHGLCADCVKRVEDAYLERKGTRRTTVEVRIGSVRYHVQAHIQLPRRSPHVGADSPRYLSPGAPARLLSFRVFRDGVDKTAELPPRSVSRDRAQGLRGMRRTYPCAGRGSPLLSPTGAFFLATAETGGKPEAIRRVFLEAKMNGRDVDLVSGGYAEGCAAEREAILMYLKHLVKDLSNPSATGAVAGIIVSIEQGLHKRGPSIQDIKTRIDSQIEGVRERGPEAMIRPLKARKVQEAI